MGTTGARRIVLSPSSVIETICAGGTLFDQGIPAYKTACGLKEAVPALLGGNAAVV